MATSIKIPYTTDEIIRSNKLLSPSFTRTKTIKMSSENLNYYASHDIIFLKILINKQQTSAAVIQQLLDHQDSLYD